MIKEPSPDSDAAIADYDILPLSGTTRLLDAFIDNHPDPFALFTRFLHISS